MDVDADGDLLLDPTLSSQGPGPRPKVQKVEKTNSQPNSQPIFETMELSPKSRKLAQVIMGGVQNNLVMNLAPLNAQLATMSGKFEDLTNTVSSHTEHLERIDREIATLREDQKAASTQAPSSVGSSAGDWHGSVSSPPSTSTPQSGRRTSRNERKTVVVGGFPRDSSKDLVDKAALELTVGIPGLMDAYSVGKRPQIFKMVFADPKAMWNWLKSMKGKRLRYKEERLWHTVEKDPEERLLAKKVSFLIGKVKDATKKDAEGMKTFLPDPDYEKGIIFVEDATSASGVQRLFEIPKNKKDFVVDEKGWQCTGLSREEHNGDNWVKEANAITL